LVHALESLELEAQTDILGNIGLYSYGTALLAYTMLLILAVISRRNPLGTPLLLACILTVIWAGTVTLSTILIEPLILSMKLTEVLRNASWLFVLLKLIGLRLRGIDHPLASTRRWLPYYVGGFLLALVAILGAEPAVEALSPLYDVSSYLTFGAWLAMAILGLLLLEQFFRNSNEAELWATKHLCIGLGILFAYDFFMFAEALLFRHLDATLWQARGIVTTMAAVLMAISLSRTDRSEEKDEADEAQGIYLSRHVAFHTLTLMASGIYLVTMALAAYFIRYLGGNWGGVLQIVFLCAAGLTLLVLLFSGQIRARIRVWLSKNFFSYKYDYRTEWLRFTQTLASGENDIPTNITRAIAHLAKSHAGILWTKTEGGRFNIVSHWEMPHPGHNINLGSLPTWMEEREWIIDLREWRAAPDVYRNLELPAALADIPRAWLLIPLSFGESLQGILLLRETDLATDLNWEDRDLLKVAGRQAASHLAQYQANQALMESRQFEAFNRLSAYVIHDLKNILAQLSLMVSNAQKHKHNPEFIDDMVDTVNNSVNRMSNLMAQLRSEAGQTEQQEFELIELISEVISECNLREPVPVFDCEDVSFKLHCDRDKLHTVFGHLIQNAQEATDNDAQVTVRLRHKGNNAIVEIVDTGTGMDEHFIQHRLFKPFDSTKGLTGMGIGAFESRDFIRSLGGDINVQSKPGQGSLFQVQIPTTAAQAPNGELTRRKVNKL
jgi:putative PEP-CTERM system histidine kinase